MLRCLARLRAAQPVAKIKADLVVDHRGRCTQGDVTDFSNFMGAVIDERAFAKHKAAIDRAHATPGVKVIAGGTYDDSEGWFVRPTVLEIDDPGRRVVPDRVLRADPVGARLPATASTTRCWTRWSRARRSA